MHSHEAKTSLSGRNNLSFLIYKECTWSNTWIICICRRCPPSLLGLQLDALALLLTVLASTWLLRRVKQGKALKRGRVNCVQQLDYAVPRLPKICQCHRIDILSV